VADGGVFAGGIGGAAVAAGDVEVEGVMYDRRCGMGWCLGDFGGDDIRHIYLIPIM